MRLSKRERLYGKGDKRSMDTVAIDKALQDLLKNSVYADTENTNSKKDK